MVEKLIQFTNDQMTGARVCWEIGLVSLCYNEHMNEQSVRSTRLTRGQSH